MYRFKTIVIPAIFILSITLIIGLLLYYVPLKKDITLKATAWHLDAKGKSTKETTIEISGIYKKYLFQDDSFRGRFQVDDIKETKEYNFSGLLFHKGLSTSIYDKDYSNLSESYILGSVFLKGEFNQIFIALEDGTYIVAPASTSDKAEQLYQDMIKDSDVLQNLMKYRN